MYSVESKLKCIQKRVNCKMYSVKFKLLNAVLVKSLKKTVFILFIYIYTVDRILPNKHYGNYGNNGN